MKQKRNAVAVLTPPAGFGDVRRCGDSGGMTADGLPCRSPLGLGASGLCLSHDPKRKAAARAVRAAGGRAAGAAKRAARVSIPDGVPKPPRNLEEATTYFAWITDAIATGRMDARTGHECAFALKGFQSAAEKRDLQREIAALRAELAAAKREAPTSKLGLARG